MGEVVVWDLDGCRAVEQLANGRRVHRLRGCVALAIWCCTRAIDEEAAAQGRRELDDENLVSTAGQWVLEQAGRCRGTSRAEAR